MDAHLTAYPPQSCPKDRNFRFADHTLSTSQKGVYRDRVKPFKNVTVGWVVAPFEM